MAYEQLANDIIETVGEAGNVASAIHYATYLIIKRNDHGETPSRRVLLTR